MNAIKIFTTIVLLFCFCFAQAQPKAHIGCRHAHNHHRMQALSQADQIKLQASAERSDTIDILDYAITLDVTDFTNRTINGNCIVSFASKMDAIDYINLDLQTLTVDSVLMGNQQLTYLHDGLLLHIDLPTILNVGDETAIQVFYNGTPDTDPSDFGGFAFQNGYAYNLGIGLTSNPPNFGRSWFPCFDNFVERSTYEFNIISRLPNRAYCVGSFIEEIDLGNNLIQRTYQMAQPIPTYLSSIAVSNYVEANGMHAGEAGMIPTQLVAQPNDISAMNSTFVDLGVAIDALEFWYGPYDWERVGYVATPIGAMEHPTNIAYPVSIATAGNTFGHRRLMAHELAHCWWGDIVTVGSARDMWVKEGNAEYGAHLMTEFQFGKEAFIDQVKDNHLSEVLQSAHIDDDGFQPLSQIPFEHIYGTHTYRKGAAMLHNMRGYLGDSLFRIGQRAVLQKYRYASADAMQYRDELIETTGYDMAPFFNDWILNPGYSAFEVNHSYTTNNDIYSVELSLTQKVRAAPNLHTNVPLEVTFTDRAGNKDTHRLLASGEVTQYSITSNVEPFLVTVNENNTLNMAHLSHQFTIEETGASNIPYVEIELNISELPQPTLLHIDHYWVAPDPIIDNPNNAQISSTHYWRIEGDFETGILAGGNLEYNTFLDSDLTENGEEDLILVYRRGKGYDWQEYPYYNKLTLSPTDGNGFIRIQELLPGEYAFANGTLPMYTSTKEVFRDFEPLQISPNPAKDNITLKQEYDRDFGRVKLELFSVKGQVLLQEMVYINGTQLEKELSVKHLSNGTYWIKLTDEKGHFISTNKFHIIK